MKQPRPHPLRRIALPALLCAPLSAFALDITVTKTTDSYDGDCNADCSLREAVVLANATPGPDRILLGAGTYSFSLPAPRGDDGDIYDEDNNVNGDLDVSDSLTIYGIAPEQTIIDAGRLDRHFEVLAGTTLGLEQLTLRNGLHSYDGGSIVNHGSVTLKRARLEQNRAFNWYYQGRGGGIANYGSLTVYYTEFVGNTADFGDTTNALGGAIYSEGNLIVRDSAFRNNRASGDDVLGSGGAVHNIGTADIARAVFVGNYSDGRGAAITNENNGVLKLTNATLSGNTASWYGPTGIINNGASYPGTPGIPDLTLVNVTIAENQGYGLENFGKVLIRNSLIVDNRDEYGELSLNCRNAGGTYSYQARGLLLGIDGNNCTADIQVPDAEVLTKVIYPLADNNSTLQTHALRRGSPAVDTGVGSCTSHDQRGSRRPRDGDGDGVEVCDLGAYERPKY
ncbi:hypothetical protein BZL41_08130 [Pseudomonas sp. PIC25]|uniref:choice-of-anchor Q domain-containing protein n=1 Tax=Pseudomonas sp. PIC25 TaxID=1958773 RepID=UPI000BC55074|nr:choice-of-anchor Q domain-containing protein [Pseudomonas sp. PIC25]PAU65004.1 hypothetical protein BZL41_08130 [Pseudomonas sp. PIC25]